MALREIFTNILSGYLTEIMAGKFNKTHPMFGLINYKAKEAIEGVISKDKLVVKGSCGAGQWTRYPWIAIYNPDITKTIQEGVYIVYLFSEDMQRLYLTLNQGCTNLKNTLGKKAAVIQMEATREAVREAIADSSFNTDNDLVIGHQDYERGSIYYRAYDAGDLPSEEELIRDLEQMLDVYEKYYEQIFLQNKEAADEGEQVNEVVKDMMRQVTQYINSKGYIYSYEDMSNFYLSVKTKPFVILAGTSGTGKSKLVKLFAEAIGATAENGQYISLV